jgi:AcrR family transcriptional regulator
MQLKRSEEQSMLPEGRPMRENILAAAVQLFAEYGYHAAPLRDIAHIAGIQAASIYHHYANKQALLMEIMEAHMQRLIAALEHILSTYDNPTQRLYQAIASHIHLHTSYKDEFFIVDTEIRALEGKNRPHIIALRKEYETLLQELIRDGMARGAFRQSDVKVESYAIIAMCTEVAKWFRPAGRLTVQQVIDIYSQMITQGLLSKPLPD